MKYIVLLVILFSGCSLYVDDYFTDIQIGNGFDIYYSGDFAGLDTYSEIARYIRNNVRPAKDAYDEWASPQETLFKGTGDCDDMALLFANIAYVTMGVKCNIIATTMDSYTQPDRAVVNGGIPTHIIVEIYGQPYDVYYGQFVNCNVQYRYMFYEVFNG